MAAAIACTEWYGFAPHLGSYGHDLDANFVTHIPKKDRLPFLVEFALLLDHARSQSLASRDRPHSTVEFVDFRPFRLSAKTFASRFTVAHPVLLRTAHQYVKSTILWCMEGFQDEAVAHLLFALEGCLLLFQEVYGGRTDRLDRPFLRKVFDHTYEHGAGLYDSVESVLGWGGMRAQLVHPQVAHSEGWLPFVDPEDYYEHDRTVRALLTYLVTDETFEDYELNG
jgi:hypothetical protein